MCPPSRYYGPTWPHPHARGTCDVRAPACKNTLSACAPSQVTQPVPPDPPRPASCWWSTTGKRARPTCTHVYLQTLNPSGVPLAPRQLMSMASAHVCVLMGSSKGSPPPSQPVSAPAAHNLEYTPPPYRPKQQPAPTPALLPNLSLPSLRQLAAAPPFARLSRHQTNGPEGREAAERRWRLQRRSPSYGSCRLGQTTGCVAVASRGAPCRPRAAPRHVRVK